MSGAKSETADPNERQRSSEARYAGTAAHGRQLDADELPILRRLPEVAEFIERTEDTVYLRYSRGPEHDREAGGSRDYEADHEMPGLSVSTIEPEEWWTRAAVDWIARRIHQYADLGAEHDRYAWLLTGRVAGFGPDHEPLLTDIRPLARLTSGVLAEAAQWYHRHFHVGRDSTGSDHGSGTA
ncbi:DUF6098 family protein [Nocardia beijingensis]|uniref:DUF6098 family protein n=1 Tax=Nocardia beijingensis TaxID=95162 RepID=UPI0033204595